MKEIILQPPVGAILLELGPDVRPWDNLLGHVVVSAQHRVENTPKVQCGSLRVGNAQPERHWRGTQKSHREVLPHVGPPEV